MTTIDSATRIYAIVGDPIAHARSPLVYNPRIAKAGRNAVLVPWHVPAASFDVAMRGLQQAANVDGIIFTLPFKQQALALADEIGIRARQVGATNVLRREVDGRWTADMFDGVGLVRAVAAAGKTVRGQRAWLIGAGGAGSAIAFALADAGAATLHVTDLDRDRTGRVTEAIAAAYPACTVATTAPRLDDISILINATPVGLEGGDKLPVDWHRFPATSPLSTSCPDATRPGCWRWPRPAGARRLPAVPWWKAKPTRCSTSSGTSLASPDPAQVTAAREANLAVCTELASALIM